MGAIFRQSIQFIEPFNRDATFEITKIHPRGVDDFHRDISELAIKTCGRVTAPLGVAFRKGSTQIGIDHIGPIAKYASQQKSGGGGQAILDG